MMELSKPLGRKFLIGLAVLLLLISGFTAFIFLEFQKLYDPPPSEPPKIQQAEYSMEVLNKSIEGTSTNYTLRVRNTGTVKMNLSEKAHIELVYRDGETLKLEDTGSAKCELENINPAEYHQCSFSTESDENITDFYLVVENVAIARAIVNR